jgi:hypothetical protein
LSGGNRSTSYSASSMSLGDGACTRVVGGGGRCAASAAGMLLVCVKLRLWGRGVYTRRAVRGVVDGNSRDRESRQGRMDISEMKRSVPNAESIHNVIV